MQQTFGGILLIAIALIGAYNACELKLGSFNSPGPGLWPFMLSTFIIVTSVFIIMSERKLENEEKFSAESKYVMYCIALIAAYSLLFEILGLVICNMVLVLVWMRFLGRESWKLSLMISTGATIIIYLLFIVLLDLPLPLGDLNWR